MVILVADHPKVIIAKFEISLPEAVTVLSFKAFGSPGLSRSRYRMVQARFTDDVVRLIVVY
jgi:hypothetical protein